MRPIDRFRNLSPRRKGMAASAGLFVVGVAVLGVALLMLLQSDASSPSEPGPPRTEDGQQVQEGDTGEQSGLGYNSETVGLRVRRSLPFRLKIPDIGVDAPLNVFGLDEDKNPEVPSNGYDVAWYEFSSEVATEGNAVFSGHLNWQGAPGVFANLDKLEEGDTITLVPQSGPPALYEVANIYHVDPNDPFALDVMDQTEDDMVTLITCNGTWVPDEDKEFGGDYDRRLVVQAMRTDREYKPIPSFGF